MNSHVIISGDPLEPMRRLVRQMEEARAQVSEEERERAATEYALVLARLARMEERERADRRQRAVGRAMAEAYNRATPEDQARPFHEWLSDYRASTVPSEGGKNQ